MKIIETTLTLDKTQIIELPKGARILDAQLVKGIPKLFSLADKRQTLIPHIIAAFSHKDFIQDDYAGYYITSLQTHGGSLVYHIFETFTETEQTHVTNYR